MFRETPPKDLVSQVLQGLGFRGLEDLRWFSKDELRTESQNEWLPLLEPYYLPCKAARFLHRGLLGSQDCVTVLRHIVRPHGYELATVERTYNGKKQPLYQIQSLRDTHTLNDTDLEVSFA